MTEIFITTAWNILYSQMQCFPVQCSEVEIDVHKYIGWARAFSKAFRSEAHDILLLLFALNGVSPACICDDVKKMVHGTFY